MVHLIYTFGTNKLEPRDEAVGHSLRRVSPVITSRTSMWNAWIGFNASHSLGAMLFAAVFGYLAIFELRFLLASAYLVFLSLLVLCSYLLLAHRYWFKVPFLGILAATVLYAAGYVVAYAR